MDVVADISATNHVSQALTRRQRDSRMCAQRPSACAKLARPLPTLLSSPDSPPVNTDLGKYTLKVDTGDPVPALLDPGDSSSVPCSAAFEKQGAGQSRGSEDLSDGRKSEAAKVATIKAQRSSHGQRDATARRGSWTRPAGPLLGPKGGLDGVDGDGCPFNNPAESAGRARRSRSRKVAVNSDGVESGAQAQAHDRSDNREVARYVARDVGKSESDNTAAIDARLLKDCVKLKLQLQLPDSSTKQAGGSFKKSKKKAKEKDVAYLLSWLFFFQANGFCYLNIDYSNQSLSTTVLHDIWYS